MISDWLHAIPLRRRVFALPLAVLAAIVVIGINEAAYERSSAALVSLGERSQTRTTIQTLWRLLVDAETGQRGYLLTGRRDYLKPYEHAVSSVGQSLDQLQATYAKDAEALPVLTHVAELTAGKLSELQSTLAQYERGGPWRSIIESGQGQQAMDRLREESARLLEIETGRVERERAEVLSTLRASRIGVNAMTALALFALVLFLRHQSRLDADQRRHASALQGERDRLETQVQRRTDELTRLAQYLQTAREDERSRLARELHDELGALLTAAKLDVARLKRSIGLASASEVETRIAHLNRTIHEGIELKRRIIEDLRPSSLSNLGLVAALEIHAREVAQRANLHIDLALDPVSLGDAGDITVYRLVQESLTNIVKYAQASLVRIELRAQGGDARISVRDNGRGFDAAAAGASRTHGLMGMRYRVEAVGGTMKIDSAPGRGTEIIATLPLADVDTGAEQRAAA